MCGLSHHERGRFHIGVCSRQRKLYALILTNRPAKHYALLGVTAGSLQEPSPVANAFGCYEDALGVQAVKQIAKSAALLADQVFRRDLNIVEEDLGGGMVHHRADRTDG